MEALRKTLFLLVSRLPCWSLEVVVILFVVEMLFALLRVRGPLHLLLLLLLLRLQFQLQQLLSTEWVHRVLQEDPAAVP